MSVGKFVRFSAATLGVLAVLNTARAADFYGGYKDQPAPAPIPAPAWQGFYIGSYGGWGWNSINAADNAVILTNRGSIPFGSSGGNGFLGGAELGYNVQSGIFVFGIEADLGGLDETARGVFVDSANASRVIFVDSGAGFYSDITGRGGVLLGNAFIYGKGGFAYFTGNVRVIDSYDGIFQNSASFTGWTIGAGVEYQIAPNLTVKIEYQYLDIDNGNFSCCIPSSPGRLDDNITANTLKIGVNYMLQGIHTVLN
jgi:outer membrane immunogenic protein